MVDLEYKNQFQSTLGRQSFRSYADIDIISEGYHAMN